LLSVESAAKAECVSAIFGEQPHLARSHWTSDAFLDCDERRKFSWCGVSEELNESVVAWAPGHPPASPSPSATCLAVLLAQGAPLALEALPCNSRRSYICEVLLLFALCVRNCKWQFVNKIDSTKGQSYAKSKSNACQKAFNISDGKN